MRTKRDELSFLWVLAFPKAAKKKKKEKEEKVSPSSFWGRTGEKGGGPTFQNRIGVEQLVLDLVNLLATAADCGDVFHNDLGGLRFPGPALTGDQDTLVHIAITHVTVGRVSNGEPEIQREREREKKEREKERKREMKAKSKANSQSQMRK